jgi:hypothetical protein
MDPPGRELMRIDPISEPFVYGFISELNVASILPYSSPVP